MTIKGVAKRYIYTEINIKICHQKSLKYASLWQVQFPQERIRLALSIIC